MTSKVVLTLSADQVHGIHEQILRESGGLAGSCVDRPLESVLYRVENHLLYGNHDGVHEVAALYAYAIATGHPFNDGNKRTAMVAMLVFLRINNVEFHAPDHELAEMMIKVADNKIDLSALSRWVKLHSKMRRAISA